MARKPRVLIPKNPAELLKLTGLIYRQHHTLQQKSPLLILDAPTWEELGPSVQQTLEIQQRIEELEKELKVLYGQRDPHLASFTDINRRSRDILLAKHAANPAMLGDFGFEVLSAAAPGSVVKPAAKL